MSTANMRDRSFKSIMAAACIAVTALLSDCASDETMSRLLVAPDQYVLYSCPELAAETRKLAARKQQLESLMARAEQASAGGVVNAIAYRPEYINIQGELRELHRSFVDKKCPDLPAPPERASRRVRAKRPR